MLKSLLLIVDGFWRKTTVVLHMAPIKSWLVLVLVIAL
jgi:hypothetical protein